MKAVALVLITAAGAAAQQIPEVGTAGLQPILPGNAVIATVADISVTIDDVRKMMENAPPAGTNLIQQRGAQEFIRQTFVFRHLADLGDNLKLGEESPLKEQIEIERRLIIASAMVTHERNYYQVSEQQVNDFYQKNQSRWEQAKFKAIFIGFKASVAPPGDPKGLAEAAKQALQNAHLANQRSEDEAKKLAGDLVKQLRDGVDFGKLVKEYSDDSGSKDAGGEFPVIKATSPYPDDLKKAIFALNNGDISEPIRQPTGFYIVRMEEKSVQPLNDVREPIVQEIRETHVKDWLADMNTRFTPVIRNPQFFSQPQLYLQPGPTTPVGAAGSQPTLPGNTVVATVAGISVTIDDVRKMMENAPPAATNLIQQRGAQEFIRQTFVFRHLADLGDNLKLGEESPLKEQIEIERRLIIASAMVTHERNYYQVSEQQVNDFYQRNQSRWEQAKIKAIFIGFKASAPPSDPKDLSDAAKQALQNAHPANQRSEDEAKKLAGDLVKQLRDGADFGKLVKEYSDDSGSKDTGGEFPAIKATSPYPDDLKKAIFALHNGDISNPIGQPNGYYIVRMEEKSVQPLNDVREPIVQEIRETHVKDWFADMNTRFTPVIKNPQFFSQPQLYLQPGPTTPPPPKQ